VLARILIALALIVSAGCAPGYVGVRPGYYARPYNYAPYGRYYAPGYAAPRYYYAPRGGYYRGYYQGYGHGYGHGRRW
jgi:hypothetical protein